MKKQLPVRLDPDVHAALQRLSQRHGRSMSNMVNKLVKDQAIKEGCYVMPTLKAVTKTSV